MKIQILIANYELIHTNSDVREVGEKSQKKDEKREYVFSSPQER